METKVCKRCGIDKPLAAFHRKPTSADGRHTRCAQCIRERSRELAATRRPPSHKPCRVCGERLPIVEFYKNPMAADGHFAECRRCWIAISGEYSRTSKGRAVSRESTRRYRSTEYGRERQRAYHKAWLKTEAGRRHRARRQRRYDAANPEKRAAHGAVKRALKRGDMHRQPCRECGTIANVHAHHEDYSRPLDVVWLCRKHHMERHQQCD